MTKLEFLRALRKGLSALPRAEAEERLRFYSEMIEDRMEEGLSEHEAVAAVGSVEQIAAQILSEFPHAAARPKKKGWEITLLILGFPLWFPLLVAAFSVVLALYLSLWAVIISLCAVFGSLALCAPVCLVLGFGFLTAGKSLAGIACLSAGLVCGGLSIILFLGIKALTLGSVQLTKMLAVGCFSKKEAV